MGAHGGVEEVPPVTAAPRRKAKTLNLLYLSHYQSL
jgi:hypothetical protein